jgi:predicted permease
MHWWTSYRDLLSLISASVTVVTAIGIAWLVTRRITISTKRTEFFLAFTARFHNVLTAAQALEIEITQEKPNLPEGKNDLKPTIWKKQV